MVSSRVRLCRWFLPSKKAWAHATAFPSGLSPSSLFSWHCLKALWMPFTIGFTKKDLASRPFLPHIGANSQSHAALENSPKPKGDHAASLPYSKERAFPPLSLEGPFCEVLTMNSGVSVAQATPFLSSPGPMMYRGVLPTTTDLNYPGLGPGSPEHLIQNSALCLQFTVPGAAPQLSVPFLTSEEGNGRMMVSLAHAISIFIFFPPKLCLWC